MKAPITQRYLHKGKPIDLVSETGIVNGEER